MRRIISMSVGVLMAICPTDIVLSETAQQNGVEAAWKACQQCRQNYDSYRVAAATKLAQGDVVAAANAAMNVFFSNMFDGRNIRFTWIGNFVTTEVMKPGSKVPSQRTDLTLSQFNELLVGSEGQYDNVLENSIPVVVRQIAKSNGIPIEQQAPDPPRAHSAIQSPTPRAALAIAAISRAAVPAGQALASGPFPPQPYQRSRSELQAATQPALPASSAVRSGQPQATDVANADQAVHPGQFNANGHYLGPQQLDPGAYSPLLEARSRRMFPGVSQERERQQWMADQEQRGIANEINRAKPLIFPVSGR
jgi:hypothetical protein